MGKWKKKVFHINLHYHWKYGVVLVGGTHRTKNAGSELVLGERNGYGTDLNHGHEAGTNERGTNKVLRKVECALTIGGLFISQGGIELVGKEGHGDVHDKDRGGNDVGRHGEGMLQANHQADEQAERFIVGICVQIDDRWHLRETQYTT